MKVAPLQGEALLVLSTSVSSMSKIRTALPLAEDREFDIVDDIGEAAFRMARQERFVVESRRATVAHYIGRLRWRGPTATA